MTHNRLMLTYAQARGPPTATTCAATLPLEVRTATLVSVIARARAGIRFNEHMEHDDGETVFRHACKLGLEGIVSKRKDSSYRSGHSSDWLKMKNPACAAVKREAEEDWGNGRW